MASGLIVVSFGGGTNSTAMLVGMMERSITPDLILFADTGGELDHTYQHVAYMSEWCTRNGFPPIITVRYDSRHGTLEQECINNKTLPSLAFGFKGCSVKWKRQPMDKYVAQWQPAIDAWAAGEQVIRAIGIDAGESHRGKIPDDKKYKYEFPLIRWNWGREECVEAIQRAGIPLPGKSACFFCPAMKKHEISDLARTRPDLFARAVAMEDNAETTTVKGLGRNWSWKHYIGSQNAQGNLFAGEIDEPCDCFDGTVDLTISCKTKESPRG